MLFHWNLFVSNGSDGLHRNFFQPPRTNMSGNFSKSLTNRKYSFPVESIRVQWIRWTPSERLSTPTYNMSANYSKSLMNREYTFPVESIRVQWITYSWKDFSPIDFRFSDGKHGDTTGIYLTVLDNPQSGVKGSCRNLSIDFFHSSFFATLKLPAILNKAALISLQR